MSTTKNYNFQQRFNLALALLAIFFLILATNLIDKRHFNTAQETLTSVYEDRVVAQHYIFEMSAIIHEKEKQYFKLKTLSNTEKDNQQLKELVTKFAATKLTPSEKKQFSSLKEHLKILEKAAQKNQESNNQKSPIIFNNIKEDLRALAEIQLAEGKRRMHLAQKSLDTTNLLSNIELVLLVLVGIVIQFVIFYRVKKTSDEPTLRVK